MYINTDYIAKNLNISTKYLFKIFNSCGLSQMASYKLCHLELVIREYKGDNYRSQIIRHKLTLIVNEHRGVSNES